MRGGFGRGRERERGRGERGERERGRGERGERGESPFMSTYTGQFSGGSPRR